MSLIDKEMDEEMYHETTILTRRHLTDEVLRVPLLHVKAPQAICVQPSEELQNVVVTMREQRTGAVLIMDAQNSKKVVGIFTERDLLLRVAGRGWDFHQHKIGEVMTPNPKCLTPQDKIGFALNMMVSQGYRHIPVLSPGKPPVMLSVRDLLTFLCEHFPEDVMNLPPEPQIPSERDGG